MRKCISPRKKNGHQPRCNKDVRRGGQSLETSGRPGLWKSRLLHWQGEATSTWRQLGLPLPNTSASSFAPLHLLRMPNHNVDHAQDDQLDEPVQCCTASASSSANFPTPSSFPIAPVVYHSAFVVRGGPPKNHSMTLEALNLLHRFEREPAFDHTLWSELVDGGRGQLELHRARNGALLEICPRGASSVHLDLGA
jgi:hypothetical protein